MGYMSDFGPLQEWPFKDHEEVFEYAEALRQVCAVGEQVTSGEHAYLKQRYARYVAARFHMFERADRGGFFGGRVMAKDPMGIATEIVRPLESVAMNLKAAQEAAAKFGPNFRKWLDPVINPRSWDRGGKEDFGDRFPGHNRPGGGF